MFFPKGDFGAIKEISGSWEALLAKASAEIFKPGAMLTPYNILGSVIIINFVAVPRSTNMVGVPYLFNIPTAPDTKSAPTSCGSSVRIIKPVLIPLFTIIVFTLKIF